jgi:hypothetical protein
MQLQKQVLIDVSADATNSSGVQCDGLLLSGIQFPATMTGTAITLDFSFDGSTWVDVVETDGTEVSYTVSAGDMVRVDPSGWAFAAIGFLRVTSGSSEAADRQINLIFKQS